MFITKNIKNNFLNERRNIRVIGQGDPLMGHADSMYGTLFAYIRNNILIKEGECIVTNGRIDSASRVILASPHTIYQAFINPESLVLWLPPKGMTGQIDMFETYIGGHYSMTLTYELDDSSPGKSSENSDVSKGMFLDLVPDKKIVLSVKFDSDNAEFSSEMIQTWYLEEVSKGTKVIIICENVPEGVRKVDHDEGLYSTLENLSTFTE